MYPTTRTRMSNFLEEDEETIYSRKARERWVDEDAMTAEDDWLMEGWEEALPENLEEESEEEEWVSVDTREEIYL